MTNQFRIRITTENAAFDETPEMEVARILRDLARRVEESGVGLCIYPLKDINGNTVGHAASYAYLEED